MLLINGLPLKQLKYNLDYSVELVISLSYTRVLAAGCSAEPELLGSSQEFRSSNVSVRQAFYSTEREGWADEGRQREERERVGWRKLEGEEEETITFNLND